ncbi:MAG: CBS domain-containing protein [Chloroflexi bacterium]|nr:CBS domain-containing protein [Chloroflexota bacterium]
MTVFEKLHKQPLRELDLTHYCLVSTHDLVKDAVQKMQETNSNCAFVTQDGKLMGIFTDRDVLQKVANKTGVWEQAITTVMTPNPQVARSDYSIATALKIMNDHHVRNLPVVSHSGEIEGNFTHHAFIRFLADYFPTEIYNRPSDASRTAAHRHGA